VLEVKIEAGMENLRGGSPEERLRRVEKEADDEKDRLTKSLAAIPVQIDDAIATALDQFASQSNAIRVQDIYWALGSGTPSRNCRRRIGPLSGYS
jgi:hypothetical protein